MYDGNHSHETNRHCYLSSIEMLFEHLLWLSLRLLCYCASLWYHCSVKLSEDSWCLDAEINKLCVNVSCWGRCRKCCSRSYHHGNRANTQILPSNSDSHRDKTVAYEVIFVTVLRWFCHLGTMVCGCVTFSTSSRDRLIRISFVTHCWFLISLNT